MEDSNSPHRPSAAEVDSERRWDELFRRSPELLEKLADEAMKELEAGLTEPLDPDKL